MTSYTLFGIFNDRTNAEDAVTRLERAGFNPKDMSIILKDQGDGTIIANNTGANVAGGAATGATTGAVVGGLAGLLIGIGAIAIPGVGALLIAGPLATALGLTGAAATTVSGAATGAIAGGLLGALMGVGVPESDARIYEDRVRAGGILLAVPVLEDHVDDARAVLEECGAEQIRSVAMPRDHGNVAVEDDDERHAYTHHRLNQL